jgi:tetratricopeptide (TPR) repeat protein
VDHGEQERLAGLFFQTAGQLIALFEQSGDIASAVEVARRAVAVDPLREEGQQHLIRLLAASGQPGAALRQYREFERLLEEDTGEEPSAALRALARQIEKQTGLSAPPALATPAPPPGDTTLLGSCDPERRHSVSVPDTLTFLLSDIAGSTRLWEQAGEAFRGALETHHRLLRAEFVRHGGQEVKEAGDSFLVAFASAGQAPFLRHC